MPLTRRFPGGYACAREDRTLSARPARGSALSASSATEPLRGPAPGARSPSAGRSLLQGSGRLIRSQGAILAVLTVWAFTPLVGLIVYVARHGGVLTGANGSDAFDQMQYLAWIRDEGSHILASNLWQIASTPHDYLHPMYLVSGLLWRLGVSLQVSYLIWKPVAVIVIFLGCAAYVRHLLPQGRAKQAAALFLALFYLSPVLAFASWTGHLSAFHRYQLLLATDDGFSALNLWGFEHAALAIGLMPVFLIAAERVICAGAALGRRRWWIALASVSGALVSWLHPWQGGMLLGIVAIMFLLKGPRRRYLGLAVPVVATVLPLIYGLALSRSDPSWHTFQSETLSTGTAPWWALLASFGPLALFAALGVRRPREDRDWMLLLWVITCAAVYFLVPEFPPHALTGITVPLAVLAVRGWESGLARARVSRALAGVTAIVLIGLVTVPAAIYHLNSSFDYSTRSLGGAFSRQLLVLTPDQAAALTYLDHARRPGGVLAPWLLSMSVPGFTGREVFAGHQMWQPPGNVAIADAFFSPTLRDPTGAFRRAILERSKATFVLADCSAPVSLARAIAPIARPVGRFGCVTVYRRP